MDFDPEKTLRIVSNLLSNAIKYTPERGVISLHYMLSKQWLDDKTEKGLQLTIADSGPGIPAGSVTTHF